VATLKPEWPHPRSGRVAEPPEDYDPAVDDYGYPRLYIFQNCVNLIEHVPQYKWKPKPPTQAEDAKEEPLKKDDHDVDALGYILMSRPAPASKPNVLPSMDERTKKYWDMVHRRTSSKKERSTLKTGSRGMSRWVVVPAMHLKPYRCIACGSTPRDTTQPDRPNLQAYFREGVDVNFGDSVFLCEECVKVLGSCGVWLTLTRTRRSRRNWTGLVGKGMRSRRNWRQRKIGSNACSTACAPRRRQHNRGRGRQRG
jgi:hypothetical protein